ncbi:YdbL family protein [Kangiella shandongensis]|uniref:YdbL family protein n=1 Tax=Kangiella shandongensis TaxID=2763258 RepID=UPI001CBCC8E7|nr:YdbL family protein [Kangiella shandongensis]
MKTLTQYLLTLTTGLLLTAQVFAANLGQLKDQGIVGELDTGYVGIVAQAKATDEVKALVESVNDKRRDIYAQQAKKNNKTIAEIEAIAARRNIDRTQSGHYIKIRGAWQKK